MLLSKLSSWEILTMTLKVKILILHLKENKKCMEEYILFVSLTRFCTFLEKNLWKTEFSSCSRLVSIGARRWEYNRLELCRTREESDYKGGMGFEWCWGNSPSSLYTGRSVHIGSDRFWLNDSSEALFRKRINSWAGVTQRNGVKLVQSSLPSLHTLWTP